MAKNLFKRIVLIFAMLSVAFSVTVYAEDNVFIETDNTFSIFPEDANALSSILGMKKKDIENYCKQNNIVYLDIIIRIRESFVAKAPKKDLYH